MSTSDNEPIKLEFDKKDWADQRPTWCPGCGDFGVLSATKNAVVDLQLDPENTVVVSGIGCSSNFPHFIGSYGIHTLHGRANPVAQGIKLANPDLNVIVAGGDGDGLAIGIGGFVHAARRNMNLTYIIMDNQVYGLTVNQVSPTSGLERKTTSTPYGNIERPLNPISMALAAGATFVARTFSGEKDHFAEVLKQAIEHDGFAFIDDLSPCVTFNKVNTYDYWRERVYKLEETDYTPDNKAEAMVKALEWDDKVPLGVFYKEDKPTYDALDVSLSRHGNPVKRGPKKLSEETRNKILADHY